MSDLKTAAEVAWGICPRCKREMFPVPCSGPETWCSECGQPFMETVTGLIHECYLEDRPFVSLLPLSRRSYG